METETLDLTRRHAVPLRSKQTGARAHQCRNYIFDMLLPIVIPLNQYDTYFPSLPSHSFFPKQVGSACVSGTGPGDEDMMEKKREVASVVWEWSL